MEKKENSNTQIKTKTVNWDFTFSKITPIQISDPYGFNTSIAESPEVRNRRKDVTLMKTNKAKELAYGQFKTVFMTLFSFYFIGSGMSLFTIFIVGLYAYNSLSGILNVNNVFKMYENHEYSILHYKLIYMGIQSIVLSFVLYRIYGMGLIPLNPADWISYIDNTISANELVNLNK